MGLEGLAITDHDTFAGYDRAEPVARASGFDLVCGVELSTRFHGRTVHMLGYFVHQSPAREFREFLLALRQSRRERNLRMIDRLRSLGVDISIEEVEAKGRSITGRPHFARVLVEKGYAVNTEQAFQDYVDESAKGYVQREELPAREAIERIAAAGGVSSLAHPIRLARRVVLEKWVAELADIGLRAIEVFHSDHRPEDVANYATLAQRFNLAVTGGSDFHGGNKPGIQLARGLEGNLDIPRAVLERLRELSLSKKPQVPA